MIAAPTTFSPAGRPGRDDITQCASATRASTNALARGEVQSRSERKEKLSMDFVSHSRRHKEMEDENAHDPERNELLLHLCKRLGMLM